MTDTQKKWVAKKDNKKEDAYDPSIEHNEIRVTAQGKMRNYVTYAATLMTEKKETVIVLKGMGRVINKAVSLAEILKRRVKGLYQLTEIGSVRVTDVDPSNTNLKEGNSDEVVPKSRLLSVIKIELTTVPSEKGRYQPPLPDEMIEPLKPFQSKNRNSEKHQFKKKKRVNNNVENKETSEEMTASEVVKEESKEKAVSKNNKRNYNKNKKAQKKKAAASAVAAKQKQEHQKSENGVIVEGKEAENKTMTTTSNTMTVSESDRGTEQQPLTTTTTTTEASA